MRVVWCAPRTNNAACPKRRKGIKGAEVEGKSPSSSTPLLILSTSSTLNSSFNMSAVDLNDSSLVITDTKVTTTRVGVCFILAVVEYVDSSSNNVQKGFGEHEMGQAHHVGSEDFLGAYMMAGHKSVRRAAVIRFLSGTQYGSKAIVKRALDALDSEEFETGFMFKPARTMLYPPSVSVREKAGKTDVALRSEGIDHALLGTRAQFWPPPLLSAEHVQSASVAWLVTVKVDEEDENAEAKIPKGYVEALEGFVECKLVAFRLVSNLLSSLCIALISVVVHEVWL